MPKRDGALVRLYPLPGATVPGVPDVEQDATPEEARRLLAFVPPAFSTDPPSPAGDQPADAPAGDDEMEAT